MLSFFKKLFGKKKPQQVNPTKYVPSDIEKQIDEVVKGFLSNCPNLLKFNPQLFYWQSVLKAIAYAESSFNVFERYVETGLGKDAVTGKQNVSEGLLQLSYQDAKYHQAPFSWALDLAKADTDPTKTIFDVKNNIIGGMMILDKLVGKNKHYIYNQGNYWAVLKPENKRHEVFLNKLNYYFSQEVKKQEPIEVKEPVKETTMDKRLKIAIIEGHGDKNANGSIDTGSTQYDGVSELDYTRECTVLLNLRKDEIKHEIKTFIQYPSVRDCANKVKEWKADISIELHTNAFNKKAKGCQVNVLSNDPASFKLAKQFSDMFCKKYNRVLRDQDGVLETGRKERGVFNLTEVEPLDASILVEPFFGDNKDEHLTAEEYVNFLIEYINSID